MRLSSARLLFFFVFARTAVLIVLAQFGISATPTRGDERPITIVAGGLERLCLVHFPPENNISTVHPLVLFFHGAGGSAETAARLYGWEKQADQQQFVVAFPEALPAQLNDPVSFRSNPRFWRNGRPDLPNPDRVDDIGFVTELLDYLKARFRIDPHRIYAAGFSSGGGMTFAVGVALSRQLAAIAVIASHLFVPNPTLARPVSLFYLIGTADPLCPLSGGEVRLPWGGIWHEPPVLKSIEAWQRLLNCPSEPIVVRDTDGVRELRYGPGNDNSEIIFYAIENMGHNWPGGPELLPSSIVGAPSDKIDATAVIWEFFARHAEP
jgi:polyhydroxybutyrate depolymerase